VSFQNLHNDAVVWHTLEERARVLASQEPIAFEERGETCVIFRLGTSGYSIPARFVRAVQPLGGCTPLPATPSFIVGLVNLTGQLLVALDLRPLLDIAPAPAQPDADLLIVGARGMDVGILADAVVGVQQDDTPLQPALSTIAGDRVAWMRGLDRDLNLQIDPELLLADPRLAINAGQQHYVAN
jgi:purine-binding chemotaxis protein CheW